MHAAKVAVTSFVLFGVTLIALLIVPSPAGLVVSLAFPVAPGAYFFAVAVAVLG